MTQAEIAKASPYAVEVEAGKSYWWCACGKSKTQPFCDGAHKGTEFIPVEHIPETSGIAYFCGCKHSSSGEICDGTHSRL